MALSATPPCSWDHPIIGKLHASSMRELLVPYITKLWPTTPSSSLQHMAAIPHGWHVVVAFSRKSAHADARFVHGRGTSAVVLEDSAQRARRTNLLEIKQMVNHNVRVNGSVKNPGSTYSRHSISPTQYENFNARTEQPA